MHRHRSTATRLVPLSLALLAGVAAFPASTRAQDDAPEANTSTSTSQSSLPPRIRISDDASYAQYGPIYAKLISTDPKRALAWINALLRDQPQMPPQYRHFLRWNQADATYISTQDLDKALAVYDEEIATLDESESGAAKWAGFYLLAGRANIQMLSGKPEEASKSLAKSWPALLKSAKAGGSAALDSFGYVALIYTSALMEAKKHTTNAAVLSKLMKEMPIFLVFAQNPADTRPPLTSKIVLSLSAAGKTPEALGWAKLRYMMCDFKPEEIAGATKLLAQVWASKDDFDAIGAFSRAQQSPETVSETAQAPAENKEAAATGTATANPLLAVDLPTASAEWQTALAKQIETIDKDIAKPPQQKRHEMIGLLIARGTKSDLGRAMTLAKQILREDPESAEGAREVCRVFKAADLNTVRANVFIDYLNGKAKSPFTTFNKEYPDTPDAK